MNTLEEFMKEKNVKDRYYYKNDPIIGNIFTTCVLLSGDKIISRGIAICSLLDSHNKKIARDISRNRALTALSKKENSMPINSDIESHKDYYTGVEKSFKITNKKLKDTLLEHLDKLHCKYKISESEGVERLHVRIPYLYPILLTSEIFGYKSEYEPKATDDEKKMFKVV